MTSRCRETTIVCTIALTIGGATALARLLKTMLSDCRDKYIVLCCATAIQKNAERIVKLGSDSYPDEPGFWYFAKAVGYSFAIVQALILEPLVYGSELGPVCLTVRRIDTADGDGHISPHFDVISYELPSIPTYESLGVDKLDAC